MDYFEIFFKKRFNRTGFDAKKRRKNRKISGFFTARTGKRAGRAYTVALPAVMLFHFFVFHAVYTEFFHVFIPACIVFGKFAFYPDAYANSRNAQGK
jgi:hypothetical protein